MNMHKVPKEEGGENNTKNIFGGNVFVRVHDLDFLIGPNLLFNNLNLMMITFGQQQVRGWHKL